MRFIITKNSPRFIRKCSLTHYEVGLNLDYIAAGHLDDPTVSRAADARGFCRMVEISGPGQLDLVTENVIMEYVPNFGILESFWTRKEELFNASMSRLGLPHRFKWFWERPNVASKVACVVQESQPPPRSWWDANYYFINQNKSYVSSLAFCCSRSRYEEHWALIQDIYRWKASFDEAYLYTALYPDFWKQIGMFFGLGGKCRAH